MGSCENHYYRRNTRRARREKGPNIGACVDRYHRNRVGAGGRLASTFLAKRARRRSLCGTTGSTYVTKQVLLRVIRAQLL